jgi:glycosyltransferase involved in cell wall biosynthesis
MRQSPGETDTVRMPTVSVCIPVHNGARFLAQAIESVLEQTFTDYELVICDDASSDGTPDICRSYRDPRVRYVRFEDRGGQAASFNRCFLEAKGELFTLLHADDFYLPTLLAQRVRQLKEHPEVGFACGAIRKVDVNGLPTSTAMPWTVSRLFPSGGLVESLLHGCAVLYLGLVLRRERWVAFRMDMTWGHDWDWELRLAEKNAVYYDVEPLACYRVHDQSGTAENLNAAKNGAQERRILEEALARSASAGGRAASCRRSALRALALRHMYFAEQALLEGRGWVARYNLRYALRADLSLASRPTAWAILVASLAGRVWYEGFRRIRCLGHGRRT